MFVEESNLWFSSLWNIFLHPVFSPIAQQPLIGPGPPHYRGFTITLRNTMLSRTPPDHGSARRRDLYFTTHSTHKTARQTSMPPTGFEPAIPASERPQTHALDRAATGVGPSSCYCATITSCFSSIINFSSHFFFGISGDHFPTHFFTKFFYTVLSYPSK